MEVYRRQNLHMVFIDLEKLYDRVQRKVLWWVSTCRHVGEERNSY